MNVPHPAQDVIHESHSSIRLNRDQKLLESYLNAEDSGQTLPQQVVFDGNPKHQLIAYLLAAGRTRREISETVGLSETAIGNVVKQPWFRKKLKEVCDTAGKDLVTSFLEGEGLPALEVLRSIAHNPNERGATRVTAANSILDRWLGKPVAHIESKTNLNIHTAADAANQVQSELDRINAELSARGVKLSSGAN